MEHDRGAKVKFIDEKIIQRTEAWHAWRAKGIGGSDSAAIAGVSPYRSANRVFHEKRGRITPNDESKEFIFAQGDRLEQIARRDILDLTGHEMRPLCARHISNPILLTSLDGYHESFGIVEVKLVGREKFEKADVEKVIPPDHYCQIQHNINVTDADRCLYFFGQKDNTARIMDVYRDQEYIDNLVDLEMSFWDDVKNDREPPLGQMDYLIPKEQELLLQLKTAKLAGDKKEFERMKMIVINSYDHDKIAGDGIKIYKQKNKNIWTVRIDGDKTNSEAGTNE